MVCAPRVPAAIVWSAVAATHVVLLLGPPLSLTDVFNYLHYGRMPAIYGVNPYDALPLAAAPTPPTASRTGTTCPRPTGRCSRCWPRALAPLGAAAAYWAWKAIVLAASLGTLALVAWAARRLGRSPQAAVAFVGLNPLVLVYGIGGLHNEPLMLLLRRRRGRAGARRLATRRRRAGTSRAGACAALAAGLQAVGGPARARRRPGCRRRLPALGGAGGAGALRPRRRRARLRRLAAGVGIQARLVTPLSVPNVLAALAGRGALTRPAAAPRRARVRARRRRRAPRRGLAARRLPGAAGAAMLGSVLTLGWAMPWYVWWVLPFAALARTRALAVACVALTVWLGLGRDPAVQALMHAAGYRPTRSAAGRADHLYPSAACSERRRRPRPRVPGAPPARALRHVGASNTL